MLTGQSREHIETQIRTLDTSIKSEYTKSTTPYKRAYSIRSSNICDFLLTSPTMYGIESQSLHRLTILALVF